MSVPALQENEEMNPKGNHDGWVVPLGRPVEASRASSRAGSDRDVFGPYSICGWTLISDLPMPELPILDCAEQIDLRLFLSKDYLAQQCEKFRFGLQPDGLFVLCLPDLAIFTVCAHADEVTVAPAPGVDPQILRAHFYGSVLAVLCFLQGRLPLHGSCIRLGNEAVIFSGASGAGKSTLAAAFVRASHQLLCDDVCSIDPSMKGAPHVWPAFPRVKLLPDAIEAFSLNPDTLYTNALRGEKGHFLLPPERQTRSEAVPVAAIYLLRAQDAPQTSRIRLRGGAAFLPLMQQIHRANMGAALGQRDTAFQALSTLLQRVPVFQLDRPLDLGRIDEVVHFLEQHHHPAELELVRIA